MSKTGFWYNVDHLIRLIWEVKSSVLWSQIMFYNLTGVLPFNEISDHKTENLPPHMKFLTTVIP